jgi:HK97 family phage prohead protease
MPYFITESNPECSGWAVVDDGDGYYGCHTTKESAIDQAVAISISDEEPFEGERAAIDSLNIGDYVSWNVLDPKILAEIVMVQGEYAVIRLYEFEDGIFHLTDKMMILNVFKLERIQRPELVAEEVEPMEQPSEDEPSQPDLEEDRAINQEPPAYMRAAARRGLEYYSEGLGGDGLVERTIREAREMADGNVSDDKWIRIAAWISRHLGDLDSPDADPASDNYPSAGVVAHLLWGSGPSKLAAQRALDYADSVVARIRAEQESERMTEPVMDEARTKWLKVAYSIKAKLEGTDEARALGKTETRTNHIELRAEGDGRSFTGYAALFDQPSLPLPFIEYVKPGAFKRSLQSRNRMMLLWNHDTSNPLASTRNGSLQMVEDARGLKVTATLPDTTLGRDIAELVRTGVVDSMSFGFSVKKDSWSKDGQTRYLEDVSLYEVSLVSTPAYEATAGTVSVRSGDNISADALADALLKIESGEELEPEQGALVADVIGKLTKTPEVKEVEGDILALKQKKLALLMMGI